METDDNKYLIRKVVQIFNTGDLSEVDKIFSPNYIDHQKPPHVDIDGPEEFKHIVNGAKKSLPNLRVNIEDLIVEGDKVAARLQWHSTDSTGKKVDRETIDILRVSTGKILEHWGAESWSTTKS